MTTYQPTLRAHITGCRWFWAWALLGCAAAFGFVSVGVLVLTPSVTFASDSDGGVDLLA
jgi:hypothetical protein